MCLVIYFDVELYRTSPVMVFILLWKNQTFFWKRLIFQLKFHKRFTVKVWNHFKWLTGKYCLFKPNQFILENNIYYISEVLLNVFFGSKCTFFMWKQGPLVSGCKMNKRKISVFILNFINANWIIFQNQAQSLYFLPKLSLIGTGSQLREPVQYPRM